MGRHRKKKIPAVLGKLHILTLEQIRSERKYMKDLTKLKQQRERERITAYQENRKIKVIKASEAGAACKSSQQAASNNNS